MAILGTAISLIRHSGEWCNWQHSRFWFCYSGFDSLLPNVSALRAALLKLRNSKVLRTVELLCCSALPRPEKQRFALLFVAIALHCYLAPSSSGLGHHPLKVAARVRIPLGLLIAWLLCAVLCRRSVRGYGSHRFFERCIRYLCTQSGAAEARDK